MSWYATDGSSHVETDAYLSVDAAQLVKLLIEIVGDGLESLGDQLADVVREAARG